MLEYSKVYVIIVPYICNRQVLSNKHFHWQLLLGTIRTVLALEDTEETQTDKARHKKPPWQDNNAGMESFQGFPRFDQPGPGSSAWGEAREQPRPPSTPTTLFCNPLRRTANKRIKRDKDKL